MAGVDVYIFMPYPVLNMIIDILIQIITNYLTKHKNYHFQRTKTEKNFVSDHRAALAELL